MKQGMTHDEQIKHVCMALSYLVAKAGGLVSIGGDEFAAFMRDKGPAEITYISDPATMVLRTQITVKE